MWHTGCKYDKLKDDGEGARTLLQLLEWSEPGPFLHVASFHKAGNAGSRTSFLTLIKDLCGERASEEAGLVGGGKMADYHSFAWPTSRHSLLMGSFISWMGWSWLWGCIWTEDIVNMVFGIFVY